MLFVPSDLLAPDSLQSLAYFYTRSLIHRPLLCHGSGSAASAAGIVLAAAGKHILQILDLLLERRMNYTFPLNKTDVLLGSGFAILWQSLDLEDDSKLVKDNQKSLTLLVGMLQNENSAAAMEFQKMAACFISLEAHPTASPGTVDMESPSQRSAPSMPAPAELKPKSARKQLQAIASRWSTFSSNKGKPEDVPRRATVPQTGPACLTPAHRAPSTVSLSSTRSAPAIPLNDASPNPLTTSRPLGTPPINLDYFPIEDEYGESRTRTSSSTMLPPRKQQTPTLPDPSWEHLNGFDINNTAIYPDMTVNGNALYQVPSHEWTPEAWHLSAMDLPAKAPVPQSLLSFSEESFTSGDDFLFSTAGSNNGSTGTGDSLELPETYRGITIPVDDEFEFHEVEA